jgi:hypothetical protein
MLASADQQISLNESDSRAMAPSGRGSGGVVGYNVQSPSTPSTIRFWRIR